MAPGKTPPKLSYKQQLKLSEERNVALAQYLESMEALCKRTLRLAAERYEELNVIVTKEGELVKPILAEICILMVTVCQDAEDMTLPAEAMEQLIKAGGKVIQMPDQQQETEKKETADE